MSLADDLRARIRRDGPMRVVDFMGACLAEYYAKNAKIGGERADFYTSSNVSLFPHAMRRFVDGALERLGGVARVVEIGGGTGELAARLARNVTVVEPSASLRRQQEAKGLKTVAGLHELDPAPTVLLANEVIDALPVHRVWGTPEGPREGHVDLASDGAFVEVAGPLSPELVGVTPAEGEKRDVNLAERALLADLAKAAPKCVALFVDYGRASPALDTLRGFRAHQMTDPFASPGEQDVTADVDFARLADDARVAGFDVQGPVPQSDLLGDLGIVDDLQSALARGDANAYLAGKGLIMPGGMGDRFLGIALLRGVRADAPLPGFRKDLYPGLSRR